MPTQGQGKLLLYLIMIMGFLMGFFYNSQLDPASAVPPVPVDFQLSTLQKLQDVKIDYALLTSAQFQSLEIFGSLPVKPETGGKPDPFQ